MESHSGNRPENPVTTTSSGRKPNSSDNTSGLVPAAVAVSFAFGAMTKQDNSKARNRRAIIDRGIRTVYIYIYTYTWIVYETVLERCVGVRPVLNTNSRLRKFLFLRRFFFLYRLLRNPPRYVRAVTYPPASGSRFSSVFFRTINNYPNSDVTWPPSYDARFLRVTIVIDTAVFFVPIDKRKQTCSTIRTSQSALDRTCRLIFGPARSFIPILFYYARSPNNTVVTWRTR